VHLTLGILRHFKQFSTPWHFPGWTASPSPPQRALFEILLFALALYPSVDTGKGARLFESGRNLALKLVGSKTFHSGVVALHYKK
jgi:hypothetical protein